MEKATKRPYSFYGFLLFFLSAIFIVGCSSNSDGKNVNSNAPEENESTSSNSIDAAEGDNAEPETSNLYHEIGETFEMTGYYSDVPAEVTVNEIWVENGSEHQEFIESSLASPTDDDVVVFVDYTVKNIGDTDMTIGDLIPEYTEANTEIDLSYPENDTFTDFMEAFQVPLEAGESMNLTGAVAVDEKAQYTSALMWNITQEIPEIVFHTPQDERRDKIGTYDLGEDIYLADHGDDTFYKVNINNVEITENYEGFEKNDENNAFLAIDMEFENQLKDDVTLYQTFPSAVVDDNEVVHSDHLVIDGETVEDLYEGPDGKIAPGETIQGTVFLELMNEDSEDAQLLYFNPTLLTFPDYAMRVNYNLDND